MAVRPRSEHLDPRPDGASSSAAYPVEHDPGPDRCMSGGGANLGDDDSLLAGA
jgi:hypothetical protein